MDRRIKHVLSFGVFGFVFIAPIASSLAQNVVSGHYTASDKYQHAMAVVDGGLHEIFFDPARGIFHTPIAYFNNVVSIASFAADDGTQHGVIATSDLRIYEVSWDKETIKERIVATFRSARFIQVAAFYASSEKRNHVVTSIDTGDIEDLSWEKPDDKIAMKVIGHVDGIVGISAFHNEDDHFNVVQVVTVDGGLREIFYKDPSQPSAANLLTTFSDVVGVAGFFSRDDNFRHAVILSRDGALVDYRYNPSSGSQQRNLTTVPNAVSIGSYWTPDEFRHVIVGTRSGDVKEVFYREAQPPGETLLANLAVSAPILEDSSPDEGAGAEINHASAAGLIAGLAGSEQHLYALSPNAGIWRSDSGKAFVQLAGSPHYSAALAVDPHDVNHVIVGERAGDASPTILNRTGLWESSDAGASWTFVFNPLVISGCSSPAIVSMAFDLTSNLFVATTCGVVRRMAGSNQFQVVAATRGKGAFLAITTVPIAGQNWIWARTQNTLFLCRNLCSDPTTNWELVPIPANIGSNTISRGSTGDHYSMGAFDTSAFIIVSTGVGSASLTYEAIGKNWFLSDVFDGDGTGLAGRRNVKSYLANQPGLRWGLFAVTGQGVFLGAQAGPQISWKRIAETPWPLGANDKYAFNPPSAIHPDLWDVHMSSSGRIWLASDGGIYTATLAEVQNSQSGNSPMWTSQNRGLHTHHVHTLSSLFDGHTRRPRLFYTTQDNDSWYRDSSFVAAPTLAWHEWSNMGDTNWSDGNRSSASLGLVARDGQVAQILDFGTTVPGAVTGSAVPIYCEQGTDSNGNPVCQNPANVTLGNESGYFKVIQSIPGDSTSPLMDMLLLVQNPAKWSWMFSINPSNPTGGPVILRNVNFAGNPNIRDVSSKKNLSGGVPIWEVADNTVPSLTTRIFVSGGTSHPVFFAYTPNGQLFRRLNGAWNQLNVGVPLVQNWGGTNGPVFVNPYDPHHIFVVTATDIRVSHSIGGDDLQFDSDDALTNLVTSSGEYPMTSQIGGVNERLIPPSHAKTMGMITEISFSPDVPHAVAVSSPVTGIFYAADDHRVWQSVTEVLPKPLGWISSVTIDYDALTVSVEGRGVVRVSNYNKAKKATYFRLAPGQDRLAGLWMSNPLPLSDQSVRVIVEDFSGNIVSDAMQITDSLGRVIFPPGIANAGSKFVVRLSYAGSSAYAPSETASIYTVANPRPEQLTVLAAGQGAISGSGIQCPTTCTLSYPVNAPVALSATPGTGWIFSSWSGDCSGSSSCALVMDAPKSVTATFTQVTSQSAQLTVNVKARQNAGCGPSNGVVSSEPAGVSCQNDQVETSCVSTFPLGTQLTLTGTPHHRLAVFEGFSGACTGKPTCALTLTSDASVDATFCGLIP